ncbi:MAG: hypothetical protein JRI50_04790 [Deltaproteobacteria bacterium]|nr:hypothetical protein [Deltaproteobacteria bacterium]MBW1986535.1 hypothetical protein [Deltaproteobacteria bacterium]MBW2135113.1 hypothetical protein [Deltaproteobacteria bacterium]
MTRFIPLLVVVFWVFSGCAGLKEECQVRKEKADSVAALVPQELRVGMSLEEVRERLDPPDEIKINSDEPGKPTTWRYYVYPDCERHLGISAPTTILRFRYDRLEKWEITD